MFEADVMWSYEIDISTMYNEVGERTLVDTMAKAQSKIDRFWL